ncbi:hypothetical protein ACQP1O_24765 [Nocardia sp. CA-151230]|uniref:hypothetical protein n=1 Tax=Nocardia sp. CA-151230 TaxID=3239982 RepID=UPI003D90FB9B
MFESCCSAYESAHLLRARYGLPVELFADRPYVTTGRELDAIVAPANLGEQISARLSDLPTTPAIVDPRNRFWIFLISCTQPALAVPEEITSSLASRGVSFPGPGTRIRLPITDRADEWRWAREPLPGRLRLPDRIQLLDVIRLGLAGSPRENPQPPDVPAGQVGAMSDFVRERLRRSASAN